MLSRAARDAGIHVIGRRFHRFPNGGVTGVLLLATSHISIHTWPAERFAALDIYSCSGRAATDRVRDTLLAAIPHSTSRVRSLNRSYLFPRVEFETPVFSTGGVQRIPISRMVCAEKSRRQAIEIFDTPAFGRCLALDGLIQTAETDHALYDAEMLRPLRAAHTTLLIVGGGDGYVAAESLLRAPRLKVTLVELDRRVTVLAREHLGQKIFDDPRLALAFADGCAFLQRTQAHFDGIAWDLTDPPESYGMHRSSRAVKAWFSRVLDLCAARLRPGGWMTLHGGAAVVTGRAVDVPAVITSLLPGRFRRWSRRDVAIPSYGEKIAFFSLASPLGKGRSKEISPVCARQ